MAGATPALGAEGTDEHAVRSQTGSHADGWPVHAATVEIMNSKA